MDTREDRKIGNALSRAGKKKKLGAAEIVRKHLDKILAMRENGHSFGDIYRTINQEVRLHISEASFKQYITDAKRIARGKQAPANTANQADEASDAAGVRETDVTDAKRLQKGLPLRRGSSKESPA